MKSIYKRSIKHVLLAIFSINFIFFMGDAKVEKPHNITVYIHGTLPPLLDNLIHKYDIPYGMTPITQFKSRGIQGQIPTLLSKVNSDQFPLEHAYLFGWSGDLCFKARKKAAHQLYHELKKIITPNSKITLIGHSHGCNVILNLASIATEYNDTNFFIERTILLAGPVQKETSSYTSSCIFKKLYSFYSSADLFQVGDPQGMYEYSKRNTIPLFSERCFASLDNLAQIEVKKNKRPLLHIEFVLTSFIEKLPFLLTMIDNLSLSKNNYLIADIGDQVFVRKV